MTEITAALLSAVTSAPWPALTVAAATLLALLLGAARVAVAAGRALAALPPEKRGNLLENLLVGFFATVTGGLIMQGLVGFARDDMGLTGVWPYLLFAAFDGMAAFFAVIAYRWASQGAKATGPRAMVLTIIVGSAWFQWEHAAGLGVAARVAWAVLPLIAAALWETILITRRRAWKAAATATGSPIPAARWLWDPIGSAGIARRMHLWNVTDWEEALELHMIRTEAVRRLRREFGRRWAREVPAEVAVRLQRGFRIRAAADQVDALLTPAAPPAPAPLPEIPAEPEPEPWTPDPDDEWVAGGDRFWEIVTQPKVVRAERRRLPQPGTAEFDAIVTRYLAESQAHGKPLSNRAVVALAVGEKHAYNHKEFAAKVRSAAEDRQHQDQPDLFETEAA